MPTVNPSTTSHPPRAVRLLPAVLLVLAAGACGQPQDPSASSTSGASAPSEAAPGSAPSACTEAYPLATGTADLADVTLRPSDFPDPPVDAVLCQTSSTLDDTVTTASYATEASRDEVLDAYEEQLTAYDVSRADDGAGEVLSGDIGGGVFVQVTPRDGAFSVAFGTG